MTRYTKLTLDNIQKDLKILAEHQKATMRNVQNLELRVQISEAHIKHLQGKNGDGNSTDNH